MDFKWIKFYFIHLSFVFFNYLKHKVSWIIDRMKKRYMGKKKDMSFFIGKTFIYAQIEMKKLKK